MDVSPVHQRSSGTTDWRSMDSTREWIPTRWLMPDLRCFGGKFEVRNVLQFQVRVDLSPWVAIQRRGCWPKDARVVVVPAWSTMGRRADHNVTYTCQTYPLHPKAHLHPMRFIAPTKRRMTKLEAQFYIFFSVFPSLRLGRDVARSRWSRIPPYF